MRGKSQEGRRRAQQVDHGTVRAAPDGPITNMKLGALDYVMSIKLLAAAGPGARGRRGTRAPRH